MNSSSMMSSKIFNFCSQFYHIIKAEISVLFKILHQDDYLTIVSQMCIYVLKWPHTKLYIILRRFMGHQKNIGCRWRNSMNSSKRLYTLNSIMIIFRSCQIVSLMAPNWCYASKSFFCMMFLAAL